ncbi:MAG: radical SAM protein [Succinivibrio dextrinosolvens]|uniref:radical SAM protein n=1 Tax=Succinivibrio sp. TaxID=2053619 RepID=UPI0025EFB8D9|nr:radical SAM protein [Succinivibrio sp.]MBQ9221878.1 radical SAM protein [Succinivibrio sp.]MDY6419064.1 radical SAM protein [Succinivibrio dextrinosolvens]MDY6470933.1 radical SAM protein [Succinivibrio dextrinosolvens]
MNFQSGINRPPYETADGYLQITEGCSHNRCLFCTYFKNRKFKKTSIEEIETDIKEIPQNFGAPKRIFLQGADAFAADYDILMKTAELIHKYVPSVQSIGGYARIDNFYDKSEEQLTNMAKAGFSNPYIGVESGDDFVLKRINKGYKAAQAREVLEKLDASELPYIVNFLNGAGGHNYGLNNARLTAKLYEGLSPTMINTSMLTIVPGTPLYRAVEKGIYVESTEKEKLEEIYEFVNCLDNKTIFMNEHASNLFHVECWLPESKDKLLSYIREFMDKNNEQSLRHYRETVSKVF